MKEKVQKKLLEGDNLIRISLMIAGYCKDYCKMLNNGQEVQECDARDDHSSNAAGLTKKLSCQNNYN
jgi:hypothetical protein